MSKKGNKNQGFSRSDYLKHPGRFGKPLSGKGFKRELRSMTKLEFGPQRRQLAQEKRASNLQQQRIGDWFPQYLQQTGQLNQRSNQAYNQAIQGSQADAATASAYAERLRQATGAQAQASAAQRGATVSPSADKTAVAANISSRKAADTTTGLLRSQAATQKSYGLDQKRIGKGEEISQLLQEAARGRQVNQDQQDLNKQKQDFADKFLHDTRTQQQDFYLGLLQAQLGNKQAKLSAQTSAANSRRSAHASIANSKRTAHSSAASRHQSAQQFNKTHTASGKSKGTVSSSSSNKGHSHQHEQQRAVQHMLALLNASTKNGHFVDSKGKKLSKKAVKSEILGKSQSYNKNEYHQALHRWKQAQIKKGVTHVNPF